MQNENIALQAKVFLYHLNNSNDENGMKAHEGWKLKQVSETTKMEIERDYYPTVFAKVDPKNMQDFSERVIGNLGVQPKLRIADHRVDELKGANYLIAFSPDRMRR